MTDPPRSENNIIHLLTKAAGLYPDRKAIVYPQAVRSDGGFHYRELTYRQLEEQVSRLASSLKRLGLQPGDRAVVVLSMSIELYVLLLALLKMGAVAMLMGEWLGLEQIVRCSELVEPRALIGVLPAHVLRLYSSFFRRLPIQVVCGGPALFGEKRLEELIAGGDPDCPVEPVRAGDTALITFTTGSTGLPKGVNRTHGLLVAQHHALTRCLGFRPDDVDLPAFAVLMLNNLALGSTSVVPKMKPTRPARVRPDGIVQQIQDHNVTTAAGSPAYFLRIARHCLQRDLRLESLRMLVTGGAPVSPGLLEMLVQILPHGEPYVVYGSTEAEPVSHIRARTVLGETAALTRQGKGNCVGKPVDDVRLRIIRVQQGPVEIPDSGWEAIECPPGEIGEIVVTGDHVGKDYYRNPQAVRQVKIRDRDGTVWHRMGDVGYLDDQGRLWLVGRVNNIVTSGGRKFYPVMVEEVIQQLPWVRRAALVGLPGEKDDKRICLVIQPADRGFLARLLNRKEWETALRAHCEANGIPVDRVFFRRVIPVDPRHNSKIDYECLRRLYAGR